MTPREQAEALLEVVPVDHGGRYVVRLCGFGDWLTCPDDYDGTRARHKALVDAFEDVLARNGTVTVQGKRYRIGPGKEPWDQPTVRLLDAAFVAGMTLFLGLVCGVLFGVYLPQAVWRSVWPF